MTYTMEDFLPQGLGWKVSKYTWMFLTSIWTLLCVGYVVSHRGRAWVNAASALLKEGIKGLTIASILIGGPLLTAGGHITKWLHEPIQLGTPSPFAILLILSNVLIGVLRVRHLQNKYDPILREI